MRIIHIRGSMSLKESMRRFLVPIITMGLVFGQSHAGVFDGLPIEFDLSVETPEQNKRNVLSSVLTIGQQIQIQLLCCGIRH